MDAISQFSLHDELHQRLRRMIIEGQFMPGDKIPERDLCNTFDVSRTPLREALKVLAAEGLVELSPNRGAIVTQLTVEEFRDCQPVARSLEATAAEIACRAVTDQDIVKIEESLNALAGAHDEQDVPGMAKSGKAVQDMIVTAGRNAVFQKVYDTFFFRMSWSLLIARLGRLNPEMFLSDHQDMISALKMRNSAKLALALQTHVDHVFASCPEERLPCEMLKPGQSVDPKV